MCRLQDYKFHGGTLLAILQVAFHRQFEDLWPPLGAHEEHHHPRREVDLHHEDDAEECGEVQLEALSREVGLLSLEGVVSVHRSDSNRDIAVLVAVEEEH